jgi:carbamoyl-phosphate synthase small subunit
VSPRPHAVLALADGTVFHGSSVGTEGITAGEVVFNTSMTGYQEILTDPSYCRQIITFTYPHIGNTGINGEDVESGNIDRVYAAGLVIRDLPVASSSWRKTEELPGYLKRQGVIAIADIDTRKLTRILREKGAQGGCIAAGGAFDTTDAVQRAREFPGLAGMDLAKEVSCSEPYEWTEGEWSLRERQPRKDALLHVAALDFGTKRNILRKLAQRRCRVTVLPAQTSADEVLALRPDGVFLSNGPGDPEPCDYAINTTRQVLHAEVPIFGVCMGHQLLGLAIGAKTVKMKFGHHGANHPVQDTNSGRVLITSQNHGFAVDAESLPEYAHITHVSLFDSTLQGFELIGKDVFCFQGHPEASPGPHDLDYLFDKFVASMENRKKERLQTAAK